MTISSDAHVTPVTRLDITTGMPFSTFRDAFETAVPVFDSGVAETSPPAAVPGTTSGPWSPPMRPRLDDFWSIDAAPLRPRPAKDARRSNFTGGRCHRRTDARHSPLALLYAPCGPHPRRRGGRAVFFLDQPPRWGQPRRPQDQCGRLRARSGR